MKTIAASDYNIHFEKANFNFEAYSRIAILVDNNTKRYCLPLFLEQYNLNNPLIIEISSGEEHKNLASCQHIWNALTTAAFDRKSLLINLGGGVIGDMGGFAASTYKRGIDFIQVPTTLLAMVDASVGGKLGIDFNGLKNQIGLFKNPQAVLIDIQFLNSLPHEQLLSGFAEVVKHALIADKNYWKIILETPIEKHDWKSIIYQSINIKNKIVSEDPMELGARKQLNFGHTYGHAIESHYLSENKAVLHGEAIALGMLLESRLSPITAAEQKEIEGFITSTFKLPVLSDKNVLIKWMLNDKKNSKGRINFSLLNQIGQCKINQEWNADELFN